MFGQNLVAGMLPGMSLEERVVLITGGANGLGRATGARLAEAGARVVLADVEEETGQEAAADIGATFIRCDVREPEENERAVAHAIETYGGLDMTFLNAGVATGCGLAETFDLELYRRAMSVNLDGVVFGLNAVIPALRRRGG